MKKITHLIPIIILLLFGYSALAQNTQIIKGKVIDITTKAPLAGASVYLSGTYVGSATDAEGNFSLSTDTTNVPLVVSYIGYASQIVNDYKDKDLLISLKRKAIELDEIKVVVDEMSREKKMKMFLSQFIGSTNKDCVINNPDDIWLHYNNNALTLTAGADKPLLITNKKLGYKITYYIDTFRYKESVMGNDLHYGGNYFFAEDTAGLKPGEIKTILKVRDEAYYGSRMFFIRALWANELSKNNFKLLQPTSSGRRFDNYDEKDSKKLTYKDIVGIKNDDHFHGQKYIKLKTDVSVLYQPKKHKDGTSYLKQDKNYEGILIDANGYCGDGIGWTGDMGNDRVNKLLPYEFQPVSK